MNLGRRRLPLRFIMLALAACGLLLLNACANNDSAVEGAANGKVNVITSFYPIYYMASEIGGDHVQVTNLIPTGVEPHDWTPKSRDLQNASNAQLLLVNGAGFEGWLPDFQKGLDAGSKVKTVEVSNGIALIQASEEEEEHGEEAHAEGEHAHEDEHGHDHGDIDPHTWISPKSALIMAENVKDALVDADPEHRGDYEKNYEQLKAKLASIDHEYTTKLKDVAKRDIVVSHQAFGYLARDYDLHQHAIMGISPDAEPRAQDLLNLSKLMQEKQLKYVFFEELVSDQLAQTLASEAKVDTLVLNPLEGLTQEQEAAGDNYVTLMERNLQNLLLALQ
ncbi:metal ABC transporter substrate-binding protein [Paenibacillus thiaminolyticus]|uniref:metal ABC transporter substrate-binding protein n=1 Tax=Paenibacillus thiaminolyticus TaxID=49283 RepID=UPI0025431B64|nr:zinc ABC transporter substrate-binding protein [Paenibacillus thiaminolyticus]WII35705.1 zinc ABC transporter substrate-binding protein [Paenibacillus thiaminolyticus]